jgi:hypothetical protein
MDSRGIARGVQQQQGNANRTSIACRYSTTISSLLNTILIICLNYKSFAYEWDRKEKRWNDMNVNRKTRFDLWVPPERMDENN